MVIVQIAVNAVILTSVYLLFALSFTLVYGTFRIINLCQGAVLAFGALTAYWLSAGAGLPFLVAAVLGCLAAGVLNAVIDIGVIRPLLARQGHSHSAREFTPLVITLSLSSVIVGILLNITNARVYVYDSAQSLLESTSIGAVSMSTLQIGAVVGTVIVGVLLYLWLSKSRHGMKVRAVAADPEAARLLGIRSDMVSVVVYFVSGALAGMTGVLVGAMFSSVDFNMGASFLLIGFVIITVGGLGSILGTAVASALIAVMQAIGNQFLDRTVVDLIVFAVLFIVLVIRPTGLFGRDATTGGVRRA